MRTEIHTRKRAFPVRGWLVVLLVVCSLQLVAGPLRNVSRPEKVWSVFHPFKAVKVKHCADRAQFVTDSLEKAGTLTDKNGGQLDAFRHAYWMALLITDGMRANVVRKAGERHEKGNYLDFKRGKLEDASRPDSMMCVMDLNNNSEGIRIGKEYLKGNIRMSLIGYIINEIWNGKLSIMSRNEKGEYLDRDGNRIDLTQYKGKWYIPKVIVNSDRIVVPH